MAVLGVIVYAALVVGVIVGALWLERRWRRVDSYFEREFQDPLITDASSWFSGGRGI